MSNIRLVICDMAGTTIHDKGFVAEALRLALEASCNPTYDQVNKWMGYPKPYAIQQIYRDLTGREEALDGEFVARIHQDFVGRMIRFYETDPAIRPIDGAEDALRQLRARGILVGLDTGFSRDITDTILKRVGWADGLLDVTVTSDEVPNGRPYPDMIFRAMQLTGITDPAKVAKAGDTPSDLLEGTAAKAGMVIGVLSGAYSRAELEAHPHTHILDSVAQLPQLLG